MRCRVINKFTSASLVSTIFIIAFSMLGAGQNQIERPPQPFFQDFFSGMVTVQGSAPPVGTLLIACINDCDSVFESQPYRLKADGVFDQLEVNPDREDLVGHMITFYLVNEFGRIQASEQRPYIGVFDFYVQNLTFGNPLPQPSPTPPPSPTAVPTPTATLPIAGDPSVTQVPKIALIAGSIAVGAGAIVLFVARRKVV